MENRGTKRLETDRLILRQFTAEDADSMFQNWASDSEVTTFLTWPPHTECMGKAWWGRGIMPEAFRRVIAFLFEEVGVNHIAACHDVNNPKSGRVMEKAGMKAEGTWRQAGLNNQGICDEVWHSILRSER